MTTITQLKGLVMELRDYADDHHDVDCTGDPPRFISNAWGEVLRIVGGLTVLIERLEREGAGAREDGRGGDAGERGAARVEGRTAPQPDRVDHPSFGLYDRLPNDPEDA